jgi:uncharacterized membrane protein
MCCLSATNYLCDGESTLVIIDIVIVVVVSVQNAVVVVVVVVVIVSALLFAYSYFSLKRNEKDFGGFGKNLPHIATWGSIALVLISIIYSISIIGSHHLQMPSLFC